MGSIVSFSPRTAATNRKPVMTGATASVIIFPGVRYEHPNAAGNAYTIRPGQTRPQREKPYPRY